MYESLQQASASEDVATIGGQHNVQGGIGTVIWCWKDNKDVQYTY
jgi:hypothetical protein